MSQSSSKKSAELLSSENGRSSMSSIDASTCTIKEKPEQAETFLNSLAHAEQPMRELQIILMSPAESMGLIFPNWVRICYHRGPIEYEPYDMNMVPKLVNRKGNHYKFDPPLTERGQILAETYGRGLAANNFHPFEIFCSPDMKSIQSAMFLIKGLGVSYTTINVEPALMTHRQMLPHNYNEIFISPKAFFGLGYPINIQYIPYQGVPASETIDEYKARVQQFFKDRIAKLHEKQVVIISDNIISEIAKNGKIETVNDILNLSKQPTCQLTSISLKPGEACILEPIILPFTRSLYASKGCIWQEAPQKLSAPNYPDI